MKVLMEPLAENVNTHCLKPLVVSPLENGKEGVHGRGVFSVPEGIIQ